MKNSTIRKKIKAKEAAMKVLGLKQKWAEHIQRITEDTPNHHELFAAEEALDVES